MSSIHLKDIYQHKFNFLIGSGASYGLFPTLELEVANSSKIGKSETFETLGQKLKGDNYKKHHTLLFMYYVQTIIAPASQFNPAQSNLFGETDTSTGELTKAAIALLNYEEFIVSILRLLQQKKDYERRCSVFTTNYDGCLPLVADKLLKNGAVRFNVNDGTNGFIERTLSASNFSNFTCQAGVFGRQGDDLPQINLVNLHGSVYWKKDTHLERILVDYAQGWSPIDVIDDVQDTLTGFVEILNDGLKDTRDVLAFEPDISDEQVARFWESYEKLPIVNPTKWKFHETVFEEHYYQMLRHLSYQLEEPNSVLVSFGFSFADEHIRALVQRSLSNPRLKAFFCCFNDAEREILHGYFKGYRNVELITVEGGLLDFTTFNSLVFNTEMLKDAD